MRRLALLCAPLTACLSASPIDWPFAGDGPQILVIEDAAGALEAVLVHRGRASVFAPPRGAKLYAISYQASLESLRLPLEGDRLLLADADVPPEQARPLPAGYEARLYAPDTGWGAVPLISGLEGLRLRFPECPTMTVGELIVLDTHQDLRAVLPLPSGKAFLMTSAGYFQDEKRSLHEEVQVYLASSSTTVRRPDIERAIRRAGTASVTDPATFQLGGAHHIVLNDGAILRIDEDGALTPVRPGLRFPIAAPLVAVAARETAGQLEAFALTRPEQHTTVRGELYYLAPGAPNWRATGFQQGEYRDDCRLWLFTALTMESGKARFAYRRAFVYEYDANSGEFSTEQIEGSPEDYCRTWLLSSPRFGELAILDEPGLSARGVLSRRTEGRWTRLGTIDGITGRGLFELDGELFAHSNQGGFRALRIFDPQGAPGRVLACPSQLGSSGDTNLAVPVGDEVYFETKQSEYLAVGRARVMVHR